jgi:hypothetical protein
VASRSTHPSMQDAIGAESDKLTRSPEPAMRQISDGLLWASCSDLFSRTESREFQSLDPDLSPPRGRDARGRFAKGSSGNPHGRPRGIRNPRRRVPDLAARPIGAQALSELIDRKPYLLRPFAAQLLPPPAAPSVSPRRRGGSRARADRLWLDLKSLRTAADCRNVLAAALTAVARGEITPGESAEIAARVDAWLDAYWQRGM